MDRQAVLRLIGSVSHKKILVAENQSTGDIIKRVQRKHDACTDEYDKIALYFSGGSVRQICRKLFGFCKENIEYYEEPVDEQYVSAPSTILQRGYSDCKGYALFCAGVLDALKRKGLPVKWWFRFASYDLMDSSPGHVYVMVQSPGDEIRLDPVLDIFDKRKFFWHKQDKRVDTMRKLGCGCNREPKKVGKLSMPINSAVGTTSDTGAIISKVAPALAVIPVAGPFIAVGAELVGLFLQLFGNKYHTSTGVRWLVQMYQYYVLGNGGVTSDKKVNENLAPDAQKWFYAVVGVPIYDKYRWHDLRGENGDTGEPLNISGQQAALNYLKNQDVQKAQITLQEALQAVAIAKGMEYKPGDQPGIWAKLPFSPYLADAINSQTIAQQNAGAQPATASTSTTLLQPVVATSNNKWIWIAGIGIVLLFVMGGNKKRA